MESSQRKGPAVVMPWNECLCFPNWSPNPPCDGSKREGLVEVITSGWGHESGVLTMGLMPHEKRTGTSLVVQRLRICLAMQGTQVWSAVGVLRSHMLWSNLACMSQLLSPHSGALRHHQRACALQPKTLHDTTKTLRAGTKTQCSPININKKRRPDSWLALSATWGHSDNLAIYKPGRGLTRNSTSWHLIMDSLASRKLWEINISCLYYSATSV